VTEQLARSPSFIPRMDLMYANETEKDKTTGIKEKKE
jgi:hypothetical protein